MDVCKQTRKASLFGDCCRYRETLTSPSQPIKDDTEILSSYVLHLQIGTWVEVIDEEFLKSSTIKFKFVSLHLDQITNLRTELLGWLLVYVGPKLIELVLTESSAVTWTHHVRKLLEKSLILESIVFIKVSKNRRFY
jgi:hypothetical protein